MDRFMSREGGSSRSDLDFPIGANCRSVLNDIEKGDPSSAVDQFKTGIDAPTRRKVKSIVYLSTSYRRTKIGAIMNDEIAVLVFKTLDYFNESSYVESLIKDMKREPINYDQDMADYYRSHRDKVAIRGLIHEMFPGLGNLQREKITSQRFKYNSMSTSGSYYETSMVSASARLLERAQSRFQQIYQPTKEDKSRLTNY